MTMHVMRLLGYKDFFRSGEPESKEFYAKQVGKDYIQRLCCLMLTYCKEGHTPPLLQVLQILFTYKNKTFTDSIAFGVVHDEYRRLVNTQGQDAHYLLCEESLLNLYIWATKNKNIPESIEHTEGSFMIPLFMLYLLFNNDVINCFAKAKTSAEKYQDLQNMRRIFAERFPQNDLVHIDYGKLLHTQLYKLMELLNFLEVDLKYKALFEFFLKDFNCVDKEDFFKALGGAVVVPLNPNKTGINSLTIDQSSNTQRSKEFLDKLAFEPGDVNLGPTDYKFLRDKPLQKLKDEYRVVFDLFLMKKLYNGITFKLSDYVNKNPELLKGSLFGHTRDDFSEGILVYNTLENILSQKVIKIKGNDFKIAGIEREPDYYSRLDDNIILWESKDFFMKAEHKLSYNFDAITEGLNEGRLKKGVLQSATNVGRVLLQTLKLDGGYDSKQVLIYPVIIVHDSLYNALGLNYWVNVWFQEELDKIKARKEFERIDFSNVKSISVVDIDTLILYRTNFENGELDIYELIEQYQKYVQFDKVGEEMDEQFGKAILPFSEFVEYYVSDKNIVPKLDLIEDIYKASGYTDN